MYDYETHPKGHKWETDIEGNVNIFAFEHGYHNGPVCVKCGYGFCHHCKDEPEIECAVQEETNE